MYLFRFLNTPLGGWGGAVTQTFAPVGKYPRAATDSWPIKSRKESLFEYVNFLFLMFCSLMFCSGQCLCQLQIRPMYA